MARIDPVPPESMTPEQRRFDNLVTAQRGGGRSRGPFAVLMHAPEIGERVAGFVDHLLSDTRVPHNLKELAIIAVARRYKAQYEWFIHHRRALDAGVNAVAAEAIRLGIDPVLKNPSERLVYDMVEEIVENRRLGDALYARAIAALGEAAVVELVALIGFYIAIAVLLVSFEVEVPDGGVIDFPD